MKKVLSIISVVLVVCLLSGMTCYAVNTDNPAYAAKLHFGDDGKFKIL